MKKNKKKKRRTKIEQVVYGDEFMEFKYKIYDEVYNDILSGKKTIGI